MHSRRATVASPAAGFEVAGEALNVRTAHLEQPQAVLLAPGDELAQVQGVGVAGQSAVAGQEPGEGEPLRFGEVGIGDDDRSR
ncbi:MAG: hypothetical protein ACRD0A_10660 [Acidimicrobiales bacterium]